MRRFRRQYRKQTKPARNYGQCVKCGKFFNLTTHHVLPKRYWHGMGEVAFLCRKCHDLLEEAIFQTEKLPQEIYQAIFTEFLEGESGDDSVLHRFKECRDSCI